MRKYDDVIINVELDEPSRSSPALGQIDRLLRQSALETQSLQVVRRLLMRDMLDKASVTGVAKLATAAGIREEQRKELPPAQMNGHKVKRKNYGRSTRQTEELAKKAITGPRLSLFILEHLAEAKFIAGSSIMEQLKDTKQADHIGGLSGVFGMLTSERLVKRDPAQGYKLLPAGKAFTKSLRTTLETTNQLKPGTYLAPADYHKPAKFKMGFKTMGRFGRQKSRVA